MGFLDNSGDIILDAVLTDLGRLRMAKGDGSFKVSKFALADDEVDYGLYNKSHASGSAYFDLNILQTPVLEAIANNASSMKNKLLSIQRNNLIYLPIIKLNRESSTTDYHSSNSFLVAVDKDTEDNVAGPASGHVTGIMYGQRTNAATFIRCEQGLDTTELPATLSLDPELVETQYTVEIDNRLGNIVDKAGNGASPSYIDDDNIAQYFFTQGTTTNFVESSWGDKTIENSSDLVVRGPRGTRLEFMLKASLELATSTYLFEQLGSTATIESVSCYFIDTIVRVTGNTTGRSLDIPVRFIKQV